VEYKCTSCGHAYQEDNNNPALGHDFSVKKDTKNATCESEGYTEYKCSRCSEIEKRDVASALGYNYATETIAPTKDTKGYDNKQIIDISNASDK
jgi:DNA-directed RNA polymerase subunit RPC12/RpoP